MRRGLRGNCPSVAGLFAPRGEGSSRVVLPTPVPNCLVGEEAIPALFYGGSAARKHSNKVSVKRLAPTKQLARVTYHKTGAMPFITHDSSAMSPQKAPRSRQNSDLKHPLSVKASVLSLACFLAVTTPVAGWAQHPAPANLRDFLDRHCCSCHNPEKLKGKINRVPLLADPTLGDPDLLERVLDMVASGEMPPENEPRPSAASVDLALAGLRKSLAKARELSGITPDDPGRGNHIDHAVLFTEPKVRKAAGPPRLWRMSPHIFMQRANALTQNRLYLYPSRNQGKDGLHPAFSYMSPPHTFRDHAGLHRLEGTTTELLFDACWQIAALQVAPAKPAQTMAAFARLLAAPEADHTLWEGAIRLQFEISLRRPPAAVELSTLIHLARSTESDSSRALALQTVLAAVLLTPEAVYRYEIGRGVPDEFRRVMLSPHELMHAIAYALTDHAPSDAIRRAVAEGRFSSRADIQREVELLLGVGEAVLPRLLRFFQEYFEYPRATDVFKDARPMGLSQAVYRIEDADACVRWILRDDRDVLRRLLTEERFFMGTDVLANVPNHVRRFSNYLFVDYGFQKDTVWSAEWKTTPTAPPVGRRAGMLTHPGWLLAFSDNEKNQAIQRGRWIRTKLLGGTVPDTPIGVDAKLPTDPELTLRERMERVTRSDYCWRCHRKMDPLGLPLEQFDDFGRWREEEKGRPVVTTGEIVVGDPALDGPVKDPFEMMQRLAASERVEQVLVRHAFRYFLGRNETPDDAPTLIDAHKAYRSKGGSMRALVLSLLVSDSFVLRKQSPASNPDSKFP